MKKSTIFFAACFMATSMSAQFAEFDATFDLQHADIVAADIDNDGDLDIITSGEGGGAVKNAIFINNAGTYDTDNQYLLGFYAHQAGDYRCYYSKANGETFALDLTIPIT